MRSLSHSIGIGSNLHEPSDTHKGKNLVQLEVVLFLITTLHSFAPTSELNLSRFAEVHRLNQWL
jgi:hypothetical protein